MTDRIVLQGVSARGNHGVLEFEKTDGQLFAVDIALDVDLHPAGASDDLADTVNYAEVAADAVAIITGEPLDLIEAVAERIAAASLRHPAVEAVEVTVHKPEAPVGVPFTDVLVMVRRERDVPVVIAMGANLGDVTSTLEAAVRELRRVGGIELTRVSSLFETDAVGGPDQPAYLNAVLLARTRLAPRTLLSRLHEVEARHGRRREVRWGARTLDLDLIQYGDPLDGSHVVQDTPSLVLPHPRADERAFVLRPWLSVDPAAQLQVEGRVQAVAELLQELGEGGVRVGPGWEPAC